MKRIHHFFQKCITVYIDPRIFQQIKLESVQEMEGIREMIRQASMGINIFGKTRDKNSREINFTVFQNGISKDLMVFYKL